ncbi:MAG: hypothetical protein KGI97_02600 [Alphaproteobacteria bacterium]|nr:hypothetical protein [Alphaproteobacteria bacterium]
MNIFSAHTSAHTNTNFILLAGYVTAMILVSLNARRKRQGAEDFLVMGRKLGTFGGAFSIAASWIWAPAIFISSQKAYEQGLPGIFWFTLPNILCFFTFVPLALKARERMPQGYSIPDFLFVRFGGDRRIHLVSLAVYLGYQLGAAVINALAGGLLLHTLTGLPVTGCILLIAGAAYSYSVIGGLRASVMTDVVQIILLLFIAFVLVPWVMSATGGWETLRQGLGGHSGLYTNIFDPSVAYSFGIPATIALISGPVADQMFLQRAFAAKRASLAKIFMLGGLIFGVVPITLSLLGFIGAAPAVQAAVSIRDPQMVGAEVVAHYLPGFATGAFIVLAFAGLSSCLDSSFAAVSSLTAIDIYRRYVAPEASEKKVLRAARIGMTAVALAGTAIALLQPKLLWCFLIYGALASSMLVPVYFSLFSDCVSKRAVFASITLSVLSALPLSTYANVAGKTGLIVAAALLPPVLSLTICGVSVLRNLRLRVAA